jgi:hypothetical protein
MQFVFHLILYLPSAGFTSVRVPGQPKGGGPPSVNTNLGYENYIFNISYNNEKTD